MRKKPQKIPFTIMEKVTSLIGHIDYDFKYKIRDTTKEENSKGFFGKVLIINLTGIPEGPYAKVLRSFTNNLKDRKPGEPEVRFYNQPKELLVYQFYSGKDKFKSLLIRAQMLYSRIFKHNMYENIYEMYLNASRLSRIGVPVGEARVKRVHHTTYPDNWVPKPDFNLMSLYIRQQNNMNYKINL